MKTPRERLAEVVERGRAILFDAREKRVKPYRDEKILTTMEWIDDAELCRARAFDRKDYLEIAVRNADFLLTRLRRDGRLLRTYKDGESKLNGYLEDYAYVIEDCFALYEASFDTRWFEEARTLAETMIAQFWDAEAGGFFFTSADHEIDHAHERFLRQRYPVREFGGRVGAHQALAAHGRGSLPRDGRNDSPVNEAGDDARAERVRAHAFGA